MSETRLAMSIANTAKFAGRGGDDWDRWITHFEARFGDQDQSNLAYILRDVLDGAALDVYCKLGQDARKDYQKIKAALQTKYGKSSDPRQALAELRHAQQGPLENAESFADRVLTLTQKANPEMKEKEIQKIALNYFLCGLSDLALQEKLHARDDVISLDVAVMAANKYKEREAVLSAMRTTQKDDGVMAARQVPFPDGSATHEQSSPDTKILKAVGMLQKEVEDIKMQLKEKNTTNGQGENKRQACFQCGDVTHIKRNCPRLAQSTFNARETSNGAGQTWQNGREIQCMGCGRKGHWLSECWRTPSSAGGAGRGKTARGPSTARCLGCGRQGHWLAECWRVADGAREPGRTHQLPHGPNQEDRESMRRGPGQLGNE